MRDLFGIDHVEPQGASATAVALDLFSAAAERAALVSERPRSQERAEIVAGGIAPAADLPLAPAARRGKRRLCQDQSSTRCSPRNLATCAMTATYDDHDREGHSVIVSTRYELCDACAVNWNTAPGQWTKGAL